MARDHRPSDQRDQHDRGPYPPVSVPQRGHRHESGRPSGGSRPESGKRPGILPDPWPLGRTGHTGPGHHGALQPERGPPRKAGPGPVHLSKCERPGAGSFGEPGAGGGSSGSGSHSTFGGGGDTQPFHDCPGPEVKAPHSLLLAGTGSGGEGPDAASDGGGLLWKRGLLPRLPRRKPCGGS